MNSQNNLSKLFPMIKTREQVLEEINSNDTLRTIFNNWPEHHQNEFLAICTGSKGVKVLYDSYFKEIFNPEYAPERLSSLISILIGKKVTVKYQLTNDNTRIGDESSLVITDIVVELEDGTLANIEVQKIGYAFTGERASCYSADLLLRQYKRIRDEKKKNFSYKDISPVYTIVFLEKSPSSFKEFKDDYVHKFTTISDTGLKLNMLQNFIFIPVDIFLEKLHNNGVQSELDAWLTFLGCDESEYIMSLLETHPDFKPLYHDLFNICQNTERMMTMFFSEELKILDDNTVKYMVDQLEESNKEKDAIINELDATIAELNTEKAAFMQLINQLDEPNADKEAILSKLRELKK
ncbi:PD-(D/E)XK nuclease family transposase [Butyrivibrio sp. INlla21]|uniref:PD-(D/E)XK nuclease family transposase n=1 Tax=Butyrivibrio sp. INlla21 TaxID=1520811 RepID=UPI0008E0B025|nr:PD-(D/E)XK nuclease family transposase [Butyrivibrio sp. INlla21]SFU86035.1 PD-(D/E)XK nuclease family transposase [Butyrivibrio sp. INlla21]